MSRPRVPRARKAVVSSLINDHPDWVRDVDMLTSAEHPRLLGWLWQLLTRSRGARAVVLRATVTRQDAFRDLIGAALLRRLPFFSGVVVMSDCTIEPGSRGFPQRFGPRLAPVVSAMTVWLSRALIRLIDGPQVRWCVLSTAELATFPEAWGVPAERVRFTPFSHTLWGPLGVDLPVADGDFFFAGGDSLRDYDLLEAAAEGLDVRVVVATRQWSPAPASAGTVQAVSVGHDEFMHLMATSRAVVVPLRRSTRSAGQQTYLNAMALGKVVIVNDAPGVRDYVADGVTGVVCESTAESMRAALAWVADPANAAAVATIRANARTAGRARTDVAYIEQLLEVSAS